VRLNIIWAAPLLVAGLASGADRLRIVTVDPGHFHAGLIQKEALPELSDEAFVYAPLGPDLTAHLNRVAGFNLRKDNPTRWKLRVYAGADYWERLLADRPGDIVVLSGNSRGKIGRIQTLAGRKIHTLADKPWIIDHADFPKLEAALDAAARNGVAVFDGMTQRFEISCILQRELVSDPEILGKPESVEMESVHYLLKLVAGAPNLRPAWFFDIRQQGDGLADVGTHLVDLVQWILFPDQPIDWRRDIRILSKSRWPTVIPPADFTRVTGVKEFPEYLKDSVRPDGLHYQCNNRVVYTIRGVRAQLDVKWGYEAAPGSGDTELAIFRGSRSTVEVRQGKEENFKPELYVAPAAGQHAAVAAAVRRKVASLQQAWPGVAVREAAGRIHVAIPDVHRVGHEAHFALLVKRFLSYVDNPRSMPAWETPYMLSKYYVTTAPASQ
jgi:predicted dehydrogenase